MTPLPLTQYLDVTTYYFAGGNLISLLWQQYLCPLVESWHSLTHSHLIQTSVQSTLKHGDEITSLP